MAIAGSMTTAYRLSLRGGAVHVEKTTYPSDRCTPVPIAVNMLRRYAGNFNATPVIVQGSDMAAFWAAWEGGE